jgi:response regulator RpfG family c-di-GMP phosphodiesterase
METKKTTPGSSPTPLDRQGLESVLVVDDDVRVIELLQITLTGRGYTVHTAFDGDAALEEVQRRHPDLVVLDVRLPRRSGFQVLEAIRSAPETAHLPVILISANGANEARIQGLRKGADDYLIKPFSPRELIMKIRRILDRVADQKLLRVRNEALVEEVRKQREEMAQAHAEMSRSLLRIGTLLNRVEEINDRRSLEEVCEDFARTIAGDIGVEPVCVFLRDESERAFVPHVWRGTSEAAMLNLQLRSEAFLCRVLKLEGRTILLDELSTHPQASEDVRRLSVAGFTHMTPVLLNAEVVALMAGGNRGTEPIDRLDVHLLAVLARSAATAIQNAVAFDEVRRTFVDTTAQLVATVESRYDSVAGHSQRVHDLGLRLAERMGLSATERTAVSYTALLHDLGALEEYDHLFTPQTTLSDEERAELRRRASGAVHRMLAHSQMPEVADAVYHLNEYWDGNGVPDGLGGESIPLAARIVAVANAYDALTHSRPHRGAYTAQDATRIIQDRAGHQFDPQAVQMFIDVLAGIGVAAPADHRSR